MTKDLTNADLENFQSAYEKTPCADVIARAVQENGVTAASKNFAAKANHDHVFSVEVETGKITNQKKSGRCWAVFNAQYASSAGGKRFEGQRLRIFAKLRFLL